MAKLNHSKNVWSTCCLLGGGSTAGPPYPTQLEYLLSSTIVLASPQPYQDHIEHLLPPLGGSTANAPCTTLTEYLLFSAMMVIASPLRHCSDCINRLMRRPMILMIPRAHQPFDDNQGADKSQEARLPPFKSQDN